MLRNYLLAKRFASVLLLGICEPFAKLTPPHFLLIFLYIVSNVKCSYITSFVVKLP